MCEVDGLTLAWRAVPRPVCLYPNLYNRIPYNTDHKFSGAALHPPQPIAARSPLHHQSRCHWSAGAGSLSPHRSATALWRPGSSPRLWRYCTTLSLHAHAYFRSLHSPLSCVAALTQTHAGTTHAHALARALSLPRRAVFNYVFVPRLILCPLGWNITYNLLSRYFSSVIS